MKKRLRKHKLKDQITTPQCMVLTIDKNTKQTRESDKLFQEIINNKGEKNGKKETL